MALCNWVPNSQWFSNQITYCHGFDRIIIQIISWMIWKRLYNVLFNLVIWIRLDLPFSKICPIVKSCQICLSKQIQIIWIIKMKYRFFRLCVKYLWWVSEGIGGYRKWRSIVYVYGFELGIGNWPNMNKCLLYHYRIGYRKY